MKYFYTYKITLTQGSLKGKFYFGQRTTSINPLKDKYKGSGTIIQRYYKKYPKGYIKEILAYYNSPEELNKAEYELIQPYLNTEDCLNLVEGGGCFQVGHEVKQETREKLRLANLGHTTSPETRAKQSAAMLCKKFGPCSETTKTKIRNSLKEYYKNNPKAYQIASENGKKAKGRECPTKGKHRVYDNPERTKYHFEQ